MKHNSSKTKPKNDFISPHFYDMGNLERTKQYLLVARQRVIIHKTFSKKYQASSSFPEPQLSREPREAGGRAEKTTEGVLLVIPVKLVREYSIPGQKHLT